MAYMLAVDDNNGVRQLVELLFKDRGYEVETASSGKEAIAKVMKRRPDIILLDYKMPVMNGIETWQEIEKIHPNIPVIMMTGYSEGEFDQIIKESVKHYIHKPFGLEDICQLVSKLLAERSA